MSFLKDLRFPDPEGLVNRTAFNERFETLNRLNVTLGNEWVWEKKHFVNALYSLEPPQSKAFVSTTSNVSITIQYSDTINVSNDGKITLNAPRTFDFYYSTPDQVSAALNGKFATPYADNSNSVFFIPNTATWLTDNGCVCDSAQRVCGIGEHYEIDGYLNSPDPNAYPLAEPDGYTYTPLGQLGEKVRIAKGEYTGTGTYGKDNPVTLTFPFEPILVLVVSTESSPTYAFFARNCNGYRIGSDTGAFNSTLWDRNSIIWFSSSGQYPNMNTSGHIYQYIALG